MLQNLIFPSQNLFEKITRMTDTTLASHYFNYSFLYDTFFHPSEASIGILEKRLFEFLEQPYISILKKQLQLTFWETSL